MKPKLKAPESKLLKLEHDILLSNSAFNFSLCRYIEVRSTPPWQGLTLVHISA